MYLSRRPQYSALVIHPVKQFLLHHSYLGSFPYLLVNFDAQAPFLSLQKSLLKKCRPCANSLVPGLTWKCYTESMQTLTDLRNSASNPTSNNCLSNYCACMHCIARTEVARSLNSLLGFSSEDQQSLVEVIYLSWMKALLTLMLRKISVKLNQFQVNYTFNHTTFRAFKDKKKN